MKWEENQTDGAGNALWTTEIGYLNGRISKGPAGYHWMLRDSTTTLVGGEAADLEDAKRDIGIAALGIVNAIMRELVCVMT